MKNNFKVDFIGIGSAKSGTTWVSKCLEKHPEIIFSAQKSKKELRFFNTSRKHAYKKDNYSNYEKGIDWYKKQFPTPEENKIVGEFSITYLVDDEAPKNIKKHFPNTKIIAVLRHPVDMLYSLYWFYNVTVEYDAPKTFDEFMKNKGLVDRGMYYKHLKKYYKLFIEQNIHVILYDDIKSKPEKVVKNLYSFLGVNSDYKPNMLSKKVGSALISKNESIKSVAQLIVRVLKAIGFKNVTFSNSFKYFYRIYMKVNLSRTPYKPLSDEERDRYTKIFNHDLKNLEKLINRNLSMWY